MRRTAPSACRVIPEKLESNKTPTDVDNMYRSLMVLGAKAECDTQFDPKLNESFVDAVVENGRMYEVAKFLFVMSLGLTAVTLSRSAR